MGILELTIFGVVRFRAGLLKEADSFTILVYTSAGEGACSPRVTCIHSICTMAQYSGRSCTRMLRTSGGPPMRREVCFREMRGGFHGHGRYGPPVSQGGVVPHDRTIIGDEKGKQCDEVEGVSVKLVRKKLLKDTAKTYGREIIAGNRTS